MCNFTVYAQNKTGGIGDFGDLAALIEQSAKQGADYGN